MSKSTVIQGGNTMRCARLLHKWTLVRVGQGQGSVSTQTLKETEPELWKDIMDALGRGLDIRIWPQLRLLRRRQHTSPLKAKKRVVLERNRANTGAGPSYLYFRRGPGSPSTMSQPSPCAARVHASSMSVWHLKHLCACACRSLAINSLSG